MLAPSNLLCLFFLGCGDGAVPAERRLRREAAAAAAEEVRRAGLLEQGGAHHPEGFQEVRDSKLVIVKRGLDHRGEMHFMSCLPHHVICRCVHIWAALTMSWEGIVNPADRWHTKICIMYLRSKLVNILKPGMQRRYSWCKPVELTYGH